MRNSLAIVNFLISLGCSRSETGRIFWGFTPWQYSVAALKYCELLHSRHKKRLSRTAVHQSPCHISGRAFCIVQAEFYSGNFTYEYPIQSRFPSTGCATVCESVSN